MNVTKGRITLADEKSRCLYSGRYGDAYEL